MNTTKTKADVAPAQVGSKSHCWRVTGDAFAARDFETEAEARQYAMNLPAEWCPAVVDICPTSILAHELVAALRALHDAAEIELGATAAGTTPYAKAVLEARAAIAKAEGRVD